MKHGRMKGSATALVAVFVIAGILIAVLGYRQFHRFSTELAWVASSDLKAGDIVSAQSLKQVRTSVGDGVITNPRAVVGKRLTTSKDAGEAFYPGDLDLPPKSYLAQHVPEGRVLYTLTPKDPSIPYGQIRKGDRLDILAKGKRGVRMVASNVLVMGVLKSPSARKPQQKGRSMLMALAEPPSKKSKGSSGTPLILAVKPGDVYPLARVGEAEKVSVVLHGESEVKKGELLEVKPNVTHREVEVMDGLSSKKVYVKL